MSLLTRCHTAPATRTDPSTRGIISVVVAASLMLMFGLCQLRLQFAVNDMERQTTSLQTEKMDLKSKINGLRNEVEAQKQGGKLLEYAESQLGMVKYPPTQWEKISVPASTRSRYDGAIMAEPGPDATRNEKSAIGVLASRLGLNSEAFANEDGN